MLLQFQKVVLLRNFNLNNRPISISPIILEISEKLIARRVYKFANAEKILPQTQFDFRKDLDLADAQLFLTHDLQASLDRRAELRAISILLLI